MKKFDTAIIGTGPAGMEAAINLKIRGKTTALFGSLELSKKLILAPRIDNYLGLPGISGRELAEKCAAHLAAMEIEITQKRVSMVYPMGEYFSLAASDETYEASAVILATGSFSGKPFEGEEQFLGRGVGYCATCDAPLYKGKTVTVLGYGEESAHEAEFVAGLAAKVYYIPVKNPEVIPGKGVEVLTGKVLAITGKEKVTGVKLEGQALETDGVFILRETVAPAALVPGIALENGFIKTDAMMKTNIPGLFAAGDCTGKPHQYMRAAGQGQTAGLAAAEYIDKNRR